ncbi:MAG: GNAT family N-acetyltransferase [Anaerolineae bacterium]|nr:MAG: GNAT family N-acetyltransferase [Anaerolineae bacterium]
MVTFRQITSENYVAAVRLEVGPGQENFVASNCRSLVQACYEADWQNPLPMGIFDGETMVGFVLTIETDEVGPDTIAILRFMIGADHQKKGYGKAAMQALLDGWRKEGKYKQAGLSYVPSNSVAQRLYASVGFVEVGIKEEYGGEMLALCQL